MSQRILDLLFLANIAIAQWFVLLRTCLLEFLQLLALQLFDCGHDKLKCTFQALPKHHVIRFCPQPDSVFIFISR